jgi:plasmid replication initiation protein
MSVPSAPRTLRQSNTLTNARYDFDACQLDILFCCMGQIHDTDSESKLYVIHASEIEQMTGRNWNYQQFRDATEQMGSRMFEIHSEKTYTQFWLFQRVHYVLGQGRIEIKFTEDSIALLKQLKNNFTTYELQSALRMTSKYAKRIYQICSQWKDLGQSRRFSIAEFKRNMGLIDEKGNEEYAAVHNFKKRVLDVAMRQINEHSDLRVSYVLEGEGARKKPLKYLTFYVVRQKITDPLIEFGDSLPDARRDSLLAVLDGLGIKSPEIVRQIVESEEMVTEVFRFSYKLKTEQITAKTNPGGLLLKKLGLV